MSENLKHARRYHQAIRKILMEEWDPIGVRDIPEAADEYDAYIPGVYKRLIRHEPKQALFRYLWEVETEYMGLAGIRSATEAACAILLELRDDLNGRQRE